MQIGGPELAMNLTGGLISLVTPRIYRGQIGDHFSFHLRESLNPINSLTLSLPSEQADLSPRRLAVACALIVCANQSNEH